MSNPWRLMTVTKGSGPERLDAWLATQVDGLSRRQAQELISRGDVTVDNRLPRKGQQVVSGNEVAILTEPRPHEWLPLPEHMTLDVLYEDDHLIVVDKPSGIPSKPLLPDEAGTLANAVVARYPECAAIGRSPGDGGLLQRLDQDTSGAVLAARSKPIFDALMAEQGQGRIEKIYLALAHCSSTELPPVIDSPLARAGAGSHRVKLAPDGVEAITYTKVIRASKRCLLVEARIHRGQRHQIRAHLSSAGFPIAGDAIYGSAESNRGIERLFLHAHKIKMVHPVTEARVTFTSPLPPDLQAHIDEWC